MKQAIWNNIDMIKAVLAGSIFGLAIGILVGYQWAWQPVVKTLRPLIG